MEWQRRTTLSGRLEDLTARCCIDSLHSGHLGGPAASCRKFEVLGPCGGCRPELASSKQVHRTLDALGFLALAERHGRF